MKIKTPPSLAVVTAGFLVLHAGCSKETAEAPAPPPEASTAAAPVQRPAPGPAAAPVVVPDAHLAQSQAAMKTGDYDAAAAALIAGLYRLDRAPESERA